MNYEGEKFLLKLYQNLDKSDSVLLAEKRSGKNSADKFEMLQKYLDRLQRQEKIFDGEHEELEKYLKKRYYDAYVIKEEDIPESYWKHQEQIALERGHGYLEYTDQLKRKEVNTIISDQQKSLDKWINYLMKENTTYPMWVRYWAFQGMLKLGSFSKEKGMFLKRSKGTTAPFPELNAEALAKTIDIVLNYTDKKDIDDEKLKELIASGNFGKIYSYNIWKLIEEEKAKQDTDSIEGIWVEYEYGDADELVESLDGKGTGWCIASEGVAEGYLEDGEMSIFYTKDKKGNYTMPRACIRTEYGEIAEVRGIAEDQNMEPEIIDIVDKKLDEYPDKESYYKKVKDMKKLTTIYKKQENGEKLTTDDFRFIYELDEEIEGFGWEKDPRIEELRENNLITDKKLLLAVVNQNGYALAYASDELYNDKEIVLAAVSQNGYALEYVNAEFQNDKEIVLAAVSKNGNALRNVIAEFQSDKEVVLAAVSQNGDVLRYASEELQNDKEVVLAAASQNGTALYYASDELYNDKEIVLAAVSQNGKALDCASIELRNDKEIVLTAVSQKGDALRYASEELRNDKEVVLTAINQNGNALRYAGEKFRNDKEIVLTAVSQNGYALLSASEELRNDEEVVLTAINQNGDALRYASEKFRNDKEVVLTVVSQNGNVLEYVNEELQNDKEVVLAAVSQNGYALQYASEELRNDEEVVLTAINQNGDALQYASDDLIYDEELADKLDAFITQENNKKQM